ncbi:MFS transporter [Cupriavidus sp. TA19]|uniref:MFS transporter n=1 Tax=Cupriavidus sp. TA19 TaxID=701108 RepID=UPI00295EFA93|nr:MFS transporter [Cupriavidus sp. TA19]
MTPFLRSRGRRTDTKTSTGFDSPYSWRVIILTLIITSLSFGAVTSVPILLKPIAAEWAQGVRPISLIHMSAMLGASVGSLVLGRVVDRFGFFRIAVVGAFATAGGVTLAAHATDLLTLHIAYGLLVGGLGQAAFFSPIAAESSRWFCRRRPFAVAVAACGQSVGGVVAPLLLRTLEAAYGWRTALLIYGNVAAFAILICALVFRRAAPGFAGRPSVEKGGPPLTSRDIRQLLLLCIALGLSALSTFVVIGHLTSYGEEQGLPPRLSATLLSILLGSALFSRLSVSAMLTRWGSIRVLVALSAIHWLGITVLAMSGGLVSTSIGAILIGFGFGGYLPTYAVVLSNIFPPHQAGRRISEVYSLVFLMAGLGSLLGGVFRDNTGSYTSSFCLASLSSGVALLVLGAVHLLSRARSDGVQV